MERVFKNLKEKQTMVHCITNYVTVNDLANIVLAAGASPIMADDLEEVEEIVAQAQGLLINIGTLNRRTVDSMIRAGKRANELGLPLVLDPVGLGASSFRQESCYRLLEELDFSLIKGNGSEISFLYKKEGMACGVDVADGDQIGEDNLASYIDMAQALSRSYKAVVAITGPIDVIASGDQAYLVRNGNNYMERVTGTGCMLGGLLTALVAANPDQVLKATVLGITMMGMAGDYAKDYVDARGLGLSSFRTGLIDGIGLVGYDDIREDGKFEKK